MTSSLDDLLDAVRESEDAKKPDRIIPEPWGSRLRARKLALLRAPGGREPRRRRRDRDRLAEKSLIRVVVGHDPTSEKFGAEVWLESLHADPRYVEPRTIRWARDFFSEVGVASALYLGIHGDKADLLDEDDVMPRHLRTARLVAYYGRMHWNPGPWDCPSDGDESFEVERVAVLDHVRRRREPRRR